VKLIFFIFYFLFCLLIETYFFHFLLHADMLLDFNGKGIR
jgi:hypothetical protein